MLIFNSILVITRPKKNGIGTHWGVQLLDGRVVDYIQEVGLRFTTRDGFSEGLPVTTIREVPWHMTLPVRARLEEVMRNPRKYDLLNWNCETFAEWLTAGVPKSAQVIGALLVVALVAVLVVAAR